MGPPLVRGFIAKASSKKPGTLLDFWVNAPNLGNRSTNACACRGHCATPKEEWKAVAQ
jgi:hypothetical protein